MVPRLIALYFIKTWFRLGLAILSILFALSFVVVFADQLRDFSHAQVSWQIGLWLIAYQLPGLIGLVLPLSVFFSQVLGLNHFYESREILAFYACGGSRAQIMLMMLVYGLIMAILLWAISGWWVPNMSKRSQALLLVASNQVSNEAWPTKTFFEFRNRWAAYTDWESDDGKEKRFFLVHRDDHGAEEIIVMRDVAHELLPNGNGKRRIHSGRVVRYHGVPGKADYTVSQSTGGAWLLAPVIKTRVGRHDREGLTWSDLRDKRHQNLSFYRLWQARNAGPVSIVVASLLAVVLVRMRMRNVQWLQIVKPLGCFMLYHGSLFLIQSSSSHKWYPLGLWWIHGTVLFGVFLMWYKAYYEHQH